MLFSYDLLVPRGTPAIDPVVSGVKLTHGLLTEIRMIFPPGPARLVSCAVRDRLHQIMPANPEESIHLDNATVISRLEYALTDTPYELLIYGWGPDTSYDHTITLQFEVQPLEEDNWKQFLEYLFSSQAVTV
jgi:hypothetical protein